MTPLQTEIEQRLATNEPDVEVLLAEVLGGRCLRVFIDHPDGVNLAMCERVTMLLNDMRERYSLEVSSPGTERPLTKPAHFRRFVGRKARVRVRHPRPVADHAVELVAVPCSMPFTSDSASDFGSTFHCFGESISSVGSCLITLSSSRYL